LAGAVIVGANGNITTPTVLLVAQDPGPAVPAGIVSQEDDVTYLVEMLWQPVVTGITGVAEKPVLSILYCTVNPDTGGTAGKVNAALQALGGAIMLNAAGKTTKYVESLHPAGSREVYLAYQHPVADGENTPVDEFIVPPPFTVHVPPGGAPVWVNVTDPPPIHEFTVVIVGAGQIMMGNK
jgi:hypothetical protein